jgi:tetratricopeptide (TPR) repeat protein
MPYCPKCKAEYREGFKVCIDCKVPLVRELPETVEPAKAEADKKKAQEDYQKLLTRGEDAFDKEDYRKALKLLNQASQINADEPHVWNIMGLTYQNLGHDREAWRSFKFALRADQDDPHALWYAAQFLFEQEDFKLAIVFISRYLEIETDPAELKEAEQLREDIAYHLRSLEDLSTGSEALTPDYDNEEEEEEVPSDQFTLIDEEEGEAEADAYDDEPHEPSDTSGFHADLQLMLTDRSSRCVFCGAALPTDAPYCFNCKEPHLYRPLEKG